jgi:hypothetical protein
MTADQTGGPPVTVQAPDPQSPALQLTPEQMISPDQTLNGVVKFYRVFERAEMMYVIFNNLTNLKGESPLIAVPTGKSDADGTPITLELDLLAPFKKIQDPADQLKKVSAVLGVYNNYYAGEYTAALRQLALYSLNAWKSVSGSADAVPNPAGTFDELMEMLHLGFSDFEKQWAVVKKIEDSIALGETTVSLGGLVGIDLSSVLAAASVPADQHAQVLKTVLGSKIAELKGGLIPCLSQMASTAGAAVTQIDMRNQAKA